MDWERILTRGLEGYSDLQKAAVQGLVDVAYGIPGDDTTVYLKYRGQFVERLLEAYPWVAASSHDLDRQARVLIAQWTNNAGFIPVPNDPQQAYIRWLLYTDIKSDAKVVRYLMSSVLDPVQRNRKIYSEERAYLWDFTQRMFAVQPVEYNTGQDLSLRIEADEQKQQVLIRKLFAYKVTQLEANRDKPMSRRKVIGITAAGIQVVANEEERYFPDEEELREQLREKLNKKKRLRDEEVAASEASADPLNFDTRKMRRVQDEVLAVEEEIDTSRARERERIKHWDRFIRLRESIHDDPYLVRQLGPDKLHTRPSLMAHLHSFDYPTKIFADERAEIEKDKRMPIFPPYAEEWQGFGTKAVYMR